jgi:hypothetical protein
MRVGFGYDLVSGTASSDPAVRGTVSSIPGAGGQEVVSHLLRVSDLESLHEALGVNVDAGGSYFGASADVKVGFAKECSISSYSLHVLIGVTVVDAFENFDAPVLVDEAADLIRLNNNTRFHERFGDVFIDGLRKGGEYFAVFEISSIDQATREDIAVKVEAAYNNPLLAAHLDVDVDHSKSTSSAQTEVRIHIYRNGAVSTTDLSLADILATARDFPPSVAGDLAAPFAVSLADYSTLDLPSDRFSFIDIQNQRDVLAEHARKRFQFLKLLNDINYILLHPTEFDGVDPDKLMDQQRKVTDAINVMERETSACLKSPSACSFTAFDVADFPLPHPALYTVPNVVGKILLDGLRLIVQNHLIPVPAGFATAKDAGSQVVIVKLDPPAGSQLRKGAKVNVTWGIAPRPPGSSTNPVADFFTLLQQVKSDWDSIVPAENA